VRRRGFIAVLGAAAAWPLAGYAQQPERMRRVGVLMAFPENHPFAREFVAAFTQALGRLGWVEGKNIRTDYRFAAGDPTLYKAYAAQLVGLAPDALLASPGTALLEQTRTIPIVFALLPDPVGLGFVQSLARPGGNLTGFSSYDPALMGKWLQLLKQIAPRVTRVAAIFNPDTSTGSFDAIEAAALSLGVTVTRAAVHDDAEIAAAVAALAHQPGGGLICLPDSFNSSHRDVIVAAAARYALPLIAAPSFPRAGGLCLTCSIRSSCTRRRHLISTASSRVPIPPISPFNTRQNTR